MPRPYDIGRARSGQHVNPRRVLTIPNALVDAMDRAAKREGRTWAQWALSALVAKLPKVPRK